MGKVYFYNIKTKKKYTLTSRKMFHEDIQAHINRKRVPFIHANSEEELSYLIIGHNINNYGKNKNK